MTAFARALLIALAAATGRTIWQEEYAAPVAGLDFEYGAGPHATPLIVGSRLFAASTLKEIVAFDKATGKRVWSHDLIKEYPHKTEWGLNISTPVWNAADQSLFASSAYSTGSRILDLRHSAGKTSVAERWFSNRMRVHIGSVIRTGGRAYGSSGDFGPAFITAVDEKTGAILWQDRSFARAQLLYTGDVLVILDEDGQLGLARITPKGLDVFAKAQVLSRVSWTPPTLVQDRLYVRDRASVLALDLGPSKTEGPYVRTEGPYDRQ